MPKQRVLSPPCLPFHHQGIVLPSPVRGPVGATLPTFSRRIEMMFVFSSTGLCFLLSSVEQTNGLLLCEPSPLQVFHRHHPRLFLSVGWERIELSRLLGAGF